MKKLLLLVTVCMLATVSTFAQRATQMSLAAGDSVITSSSRDTVTKIFTNTSPGSVVGVEITGTKVSGTISAKAYLYGSLLGVSYNLIDSSAAFANQTTNLAWFNKSLLPYVYYKVTVQDPIGGATSTQSMQVRVTYSIKQ